MTRIRISTTVDGEALAGARALGLGSDAAMLDAALEALLSAHRATEIDSAYAAYDRVPLSKPDAWGDVEAFRDAVHRAGRRQRSRRAS
jgi:hypothetical protein